MDRKFNDIQQTILDAKTTAASLNALEVLTTSEQTLSNANSTSKVSIWRLWVWIFTYIIWNSEKIVTENAKNSRPQNLPNFIATVLNYHDGLDLVWKNGSFQYDLTNVINPETRKIIARCAVLESNDEELVVKIAVDSGGNLQPATPVQETRILAYLKQLKVPGVPVRLINQNADLLKLNLTCYVNTLIIDTATGALLNTTTPTYPVKEAINKYLSDLSKYELNGIVVEQHLRETIAEAEGMKLIEINQLQWKYAGFPFQDIDKWKVSEAGYFKINPADLIINYLPYGLVNA